MLSKEAMHRFYSTGYSSPLKDWSHDPMWEDAEVRMVVMMGIHDRDKQNLARTPESFEAGTVQTSPVVVHLERLKNEANRIGAIKAVRELHAEDGGLGLKEAKDVVDALVLGRSYRMSFEADLWKTRYISVANEHFFLRYEVS